jgi:hypothetical protein
MALRLGSSTPTKLYLGATEVAKAYLGTVEVYSSAVAAWTPADLGAALALWLDADDAGTITLNGTTVAQWDDKSGNGNHVSNGVAANQPVYEATGFNGLPTVNWGPFTHALRTSMSLPVTDLNLFFVADPNLPTQTSYILDIENARRIFATNGPIFSGSWNPASNPITGAGQRIYGFTTGPTNQIVYENGTAVSTLPPIPAAVVSGVVALGNRFLSNNNGLNGKMSEVVMVSSTMTSDDRQKLEGYLAWKWGLTFELPADHPYKLYGSLFGSAYQDGFDADAQAYITAVETADAQALEPAVKTAINNFVVGCKADGIWDAIKSSCIMAGARTLSGALVPLKGTGPTNFNFVTGDYDRKTGLVGDGSTKYLDSNRNNNADPQNNAHLSCYISTVASATGAHIGCAQAAGGLSWIVRNANVGLILQTRGIDNSIPTVNSHLTTGFKGATRSDSTQMTRRFDGATATVDINSTATNANNYFVFASNTGISAVIFANGRLAFYSIGESIDLALLDARVTTLINAYGAI